MDIRSIQNLKNFASALAKKAEQQEQFFTGVLAERLTQAAQADPTDTTVVAMAKFLERRAQADAILISRKDLQNAYGKFYTNRSKCGSLLERELGLEKLATPKAAEFDNSQESLSDRLKKATDEKLVNIFEAAIEGKSTYKTITKAAINSAVTACKSYMPGNPPVEVRASREGLILCEASYETPKGRVHFYVPVEIDNSDRAIAPSVFISPLGVSEISRDNVLNQVVASAGKKSKYQAAEIMQAIGMTKSAGSISDVDLVVAASKIEKTASSPVTGDNIILNKKNYQSELGEVRHDRSVNSFVYSHNLNSDAALVDSLFGKETVNRARSIVLNKLTSLGYVNPQIKVTGGTSDSITIVASVNGCGFTVPVEVRAKSVVAPTKIFAKGSVEVFDVDGVKRLLSFEDRKTASTAGGYNLNSPNTLISLLQTKLAQKEDPSEVLDAIHATGDSAAFKFAFELYRDSLTKTAEVVKPKSIRIGGKEVCAQTFLPIENVYYDEHGIAHAKHRKNLDKTEQKPASFITAIAASQGFKV